MSPLKALGLGRGVVGGEFRADFKHVNRNLCRKLLGEMMLNVFAFREGVL